MHIIAISQREFDAKESDRWKKTEWTLRVLENCSDVGRF